MIFRHVFSFLRHVSFQRSAREMRLAVNVCMCSADKRPRTPRVRVTAQEPLSSTAGQPDAPGWPDRLRSDPLRIWVSLA